MSLLPERTNQKRGINFQLFCSDQDKSALEDPKGPRTLEDPGP